MPGSDSAKHAELTQANLAAQHARHHAEAAKGSLDRRDADITEALFQNHRALEDAAAIQMAGEFEEMGKHADALRAEVAGLETKLLAGRDLFGFKASKFYDDNKVARIAYCTAHDAAGNAYSKDLSPGVFSNAGRKDVAEIEKQFDALVEGK